jgi:hypothetical protein
MVTMIPRNPVGCMMKSAHHISPCIECIWGTFQHASPGIYMCVVSANITCLPSNLSPSHSYYQHGHCGISETRGVVDGGRLSYFPHASSASGAPSNTTKPGHLYVRCECKNTLFALKIVFSSKLLSTRSLQYLVMLGNAEWRL